MDSNSVHIPDEVMRGIRRKATEDWPDDYVMQKAAIRDQVRAYKDLEAGGPWEDSEDEADDSEDTEDPDESTSYSVPVWDRPPSPEHVGGGIVSAIATVINGVFVGIGLYLLYGVVYVCLFAFIVWFFVSCTIDAFK